MQGPKCGNQGKEEPKNIICEEGYGAESHILKLEGKENTKIMIFLKTLFNSLRRQRKFW